MLRILLLVSLFILQSFSETRLCGVLEGSQTWTLQKSPIIITGDLYIPKNSRLSIEAGVQVLFEAPLPCADEVVQLNWADSQWTSIKIDGALYIRGSPDKPILFAPVKPNKAGPGWDGIYLRYKSRAMTFIEGAHFMGAHKAIYALGTEIALHHCLFDGNTHGIVLEQASHLHIYNSIFTRNQSAGIKIQESNPIIENNLFYKNRGFGIRADSRVEVTVRHNAFFENTEGSCHKCPAGVLIPLKRNEKGDSLDRYNNLYADPVLPLTPAWEEARRKDKRFPTPLNQVLDTQMAVSHARFRKKSLPVPDTLAPQGNGNWKLSIYSPLIDGGNPAKTFQDTDGSVNDIGIFGGKY